MTESSLLPFRKLEYNSIWIRFQKMRMERLLSWGIFFARTGHYSGR